MVAELKRDEITYSELKNNVKGVMLGEEELFLEVKRKGKLWQLRLRDMFTNDNLTAWISVLSLEDLRQSRRCNSIRGKLKQQWSNHIDIIEKILIELEAHKEEWKKKKELKETSSSFSEAVESSIQVELAKIVNAQNQVETLQPHLNNIIVGEENNKKAVFVLLTGSKHSNVAMKQIILLKGTEGGGKSTLAKELSRNYKVKEVGRFSAHALDYSNLEGFDVLFLKELGSMDMEKQGVSTLKFLSSDDRGYTVEVTVKDEETGKFTTEQHLIPCMTVISTTTRLVLEPQFERRAWLFNIDETTEQTKRVLRWKAMRKKQEAEKLLGFHEVTDYEFSREVLKRFIEQWNPTNIIIPFPVILTEVLGSKVLRIRGDLDKLYSFIQLYASLNIKRLRKLKENVYAVTPEVCMEALQTIMKPLSNMISQMDERTTKLLHVLKELELDKTQDVVGKHNREQIAVKLGKSENTVLKLLNFLEHSGFLSGDGKKPKSHTLLYSVTKIEEKLRGISGILESPDVLMEKMWKEGQEWLKTLCGDETLEDVSYLNENRHIKYAQEHKKPLNNTCILEKSSPHPKLSPSTPSLTETTMNNQAKQKHPILPEETLNKSERRGNAAHHTKTVTVPTLEKELPGIAQREGNKIITEDGSILYQCPVCWKFQKQMFFGSRADLNIHLERCHSGYVEEFSDDKVTAIIDFIPSEYGVCPRCGQKKEKSKQARYHNGSWAPICEECARVLNELQKKPDGPNPAVELPQFSVVLQRSLKND